MASIVEQEASSPLVLLCVGGGLDGVPHPAFQPMLGKPFLFHQLKQLERLGVSKVAVSVESVPPALPTIVEQLDRPGFNIRILRTPADLTALVTDSQPVFVKSADIQISDDNLAGLLQHTGRFIARLPEQPEHVAFERIDLASRWAGLAMIDGMIARQASVIPEGWSLDSCLLRQALQSGVPLQDMEAGLVLANRLNKVGGAGTIEIAEEHLLPASLDSEDVFGKGLNRIGRKWLPAILARPWAVIATSLSVPAFSAVSALLGYFEIVVGATAAGSLALVLSPFRKLCLSADYRNRRDYVGDASLGLLALALALTLWAVGEAPLESLFLTVLLVLAFWMQKPLAKRGLSRQFSLIPIALLLTGASAAGLVVPALKVVLLIKLALLAIDARKSASANQS
ncbi:hypothetical protein DXH95_05995 [Sphingorhabdus pulchriflava]|uniref:MobA-like NTP transferase domain-containing protein n=1 Tax=Sphingorhabdus pulchriflava TaxID=2292257 RepID=A0A371BH65_9SPHN|nr:hypothetical protein [Sphingorhabdus pulchriflava]RDV06944.1 hypothetical protein DXH95_05995 [Sphingorhabdus pulchriflava]